jgi:ABC-type antimicrobial peptide transport system permease subunit
LDYDLEARPAVRRTAILTFGLSILILVTACLSLALLAVARGVAQQSQAALLLAIGGTRSRIRRTFLFEGGFVALLGAAAGLVLTVWLMDVGESLGATYGREIFLTPIVLQIAVSMTVVAALLVGMMPSVVALQGSLSEGLKRGGRVAQPHVRLRTGLLVAQLGLSVLLVHYALIFIGDVRALARVDVGFEVDDLRVYSLTAQSPRRDLSEDYFVALRDLVAAIPGVEQVGLSGGVTPLMATNDFTQSVSTALGRETRSITNCAWPGFLEVLGLPLSGGTDFSGVAQPEALITETLARQLYAPVNPLGQTILVPVAREPKPKALRIVGITEDIAFNGQRLGARPAVFMPCLTQTSPWPSTFVTNIVVRSKRSLDDLRPLIVSAVDKLGAQYVYNLRDVADDFEASVQQERMLATVASALGALVMFVTGVALFAFSSYLATFRAREFAIRAALGATPVRISASLLREVAIILWVGSAAGLACTMTIRRVMAATIAGTPSPRTEDLLVGVLLVASVVVAATIVPTLRTLRLDLPQALRVE